MGHYRIVIVIIPLLLIVHSVNAQQTVFNVPSGDVLDRGKAYAELDATYRNSDVSGNFTPRLVVGVGTRVEVGLNLNGFGFPGSQQIVPAPTIKWKIYEGKENGWAWFVGDDIFLPVVHRSYNAGNYVWTELTRTWKSGTRATVGVYQITPKVVAEKQKTGGQFAIEQPLGKRVTFATDWFTGDSSIGYVTPGVILKLTPKLTWYGSYQLGNRRLTEGNHQFLFEIGYNFN